AKIFPLARNAMLFAPDRLNHVPVANLPVKRPIVTAPTAALVARCWPMKRNLPTIKYLLWRGARYTWAMLML
ncbi:hypothetical protein, partial [Mesorhizobium sp. M4A.F.Ca.ET.050.02.1.1]|uniref:hypothetical protein n=1 Tax=Mesorhizobium sp. M4A.F.Ca.ET.050.02.1.1 TaxID=2496754 RepID=UPI001AECBC59